MPVLDSPTCLIDGVVCAAGKLRRVFRGQIALRAFPEVPHVLAPVEEEDGVACIPTLQDFVNHIRPSPIVIAPITPKTRALGAGFGRAKRLSVESGKTRTQ